MTIEEIKALPLIQQIELMGQIANGTDFDELSYLYTEMLDDALQGLHRDATDQAAAENDGLHGKEVAMLTDMWVSPCGVRVGG